MHVLTQKHLKEAAGRFPDAAKQITAWQSVARHARWHNPAEVKDMFADVDYQGDYVIFRILQNQYRLVTTIHYAREKNGALAQGHVWVRSFLSNKQFENPANWERGASR